MKRTIFTGDNFSPEIEEEIKFVTPYIVSFLLEWHTRVGDPSVLYNAAIQSIYVYINAIKNDQTPMIKLAEEFSEHFLLFSKNLEKEKK